MSFQTFLQRKLLEALAGSATAPVGNPMQNLPAPPAPQLALQQQMGQQQQRAQMQAQIAASTPPPPPAPTFNPVAAIAALRSGMSTPTSRYGAPPVSPDPSYLTPQGQINVPTANALGAGNDPYNPVPSTGFDVGAAIAGLRSGVQTPLSRLQAPGPGYLPSELKPNALGQFWVTDPDGTKHPTTPEIENAKSQQAAQQQADVQDTIAGKTDLMTLIAPVLSAADWGRKNVGRPVVGEVLYRMAQGDNLVGGLPIGAVTIHEILDFYGGKEAILKAHDEGGDVGVWENVVAAKGEHLVPGDNPISSFINKVLRVPYHGATDVAIDPVTYLTAGASDLFKSEGRGLGILRPEGEPLTVSEVVAGKRVPKPNAPVASTDPYAKELQTIIGDKGGTTFQAGQVAPVGREVIQNLPGVKTSNASQVAQTQAEVGDFSARLHKAGIRPPEDLTTIEQIEVTGKNGKPQARLKWQPFDEQHNPIGEPVGTKADAQRNLDLHKQKVVTDKGQLGIIDQGERGGTATLERPPEVTPVTVEPPVETQPLTGSPRPRYRVVSDRGLNRNVEVIDERDGSVVWRGSNWSGSEADAVAKKLNSELSSPSLAQESATDIARSTVEPDYEKLSAYKTKADRIAAIKRGEISTWDPTPSGPRLIDRAAFGVGAENPERRTAFFTDLRNQLDAHKQKMAQIDRELGARVKSGEIVLNQKVAEEAVTDAEFVADTVTPLYKQHFGDLDPLAEVPMPGRHTVNGKKISFAKESDTGLVQASVFSPNKASSDGAFAVLTERWSKQPWGGDMLERVKAARTQAEAAYTGAASPDEHTIESIFGGHTPIEQVPGQREWEAANPKWHQLPEETFPEYEVPVETIKATQPGLNQKAVKFYVEHGLDARYPEGGGGDVLGYFHDGNVYLDEGTSRGAAAKLRGDETIKVRLLNEDEYNAWEAAQTSAPEAVSPQMTPPATTPARVIGPQSVDVAAVDAKNAIDDAFNAGKVDAADLAFARQRVTIEPGMEVRYEEAKPGKGGVKSKGPKYIKLDGGETTIGDLYLEIAQKVGITNAMTDEAYQLALVKAEKAFASALRGAERGPFTGLNLGGMPKFVKGIDAIQSTYRDAMMYNPFNIKGFVGDKSSDFVTAVLHGDFGAAAKILSPRDNWHAIQYANASPEARDALRRQIDGVTNMEDGLGMLHETALDIGTASGAETSVGVGPTTIQRGLRKVTGEGGLAKAGDILVAPVSGSRTVKLLRTALGEQTRYAVFYSSVRRNLPTSTERFFNSLDVVAAKLGVDGEAWKRDILARGKARVEETGGKWRGEFSADDVAEVTHNTDLSRKWTNEVSTLRKEADAYQKRLYFDYNTRTQLDEVMKRTFLYHMWFTRQFKLYARLSLENPWLLNAEYLAWSEAKERSKAQGHGSGVAGVLNYMATFGYTIQGNAVANFIPFMMLSSLSDNDGFDHAHDNALDRLMSKSPLMIAPYVKALATDIGWAHKDPSFIPGRTFRRDIRTGINLMASHGIDVLAPFAGKADPVSEFEIALTEQAQRLMDKGPFPFTKAEKFLDPMDTEEVAISQIIEEDAATQFGDPGENMQNWSAEQQKLVLDAEAGDDNELRQAAEKRYWGAQGVTRLLNDVTPGGAWASDPTAKANKDLAKSGYGEGNATPETRAAQDRQNRVTSADPQQEGLFQQYANLGTPDQQTIRNGYDAIAYGAFDDGQIVDLNGQQYTKAYLKRHPDEAKALAEQWVTGVGGTEDLATIRDLRTKFQDTNPSIGAFEQFKGDMRDAPGGQVAAAEYLATTSPSFKAYWDGSQQDEAAALSQDAFLAWQGQPTSIYGDKLPAQDPSAVPVTIPGSGGSGGPGGGRKFDPVASLTTSLLKYNAKMTAADQFASEYTHGRAQRFQDLDIYAKQYVGQQLRLLGINPEPTGTLATYLYWRDNIATKGKDSPADFIAWRDSYTNPAMQGVTELTNQVANSDQP